jgi:hypothetical protein
VRVVAFRIDPDPFSIVQSREAQLDELAAGNTYEDTHMYPSGPAFTMGFMMKDTVFWSATGVQGEFPSTVRVSITEPAAISAAEGEYSGLSRVLFENVPVPEVVHSSDAKLAALASERGTEVFSQTETSAPALLIGAGTRDRTMVSDVVTMHGDKEEAVRNKCTLPAAISAPPGV